VVACSILPINENTLIYGSSDGGKTIFDKNEEFKSRIRLVVQKLNIEGQCLMDAKGKKLFLYG